VHSTGSALDAAGGAVLVVVATLGALVLGRVVVALAGRAGGAGARRLIRGASRCADVLRVVGLRRALTATLGLGASGFSHLVGAGPAGALQVPAHAPVDGGPGVPTVGADVDGRPSWAGLDRVAAGTSTVGIAPVVVVAPGDTLWSIAQRRLGPRASSSEVARAWPAWYRLNRDRIGPDPSLLHPGTRLRVPDLRRTGTSATSHDRPAPAPAPSRVPATSLDPDRR
jgi:hypothetical protein